RPPSQPEQTMSDAIELPRFFTVRPRLVSRGIASVATEVVQRLSPHRDRFSRDASVAVAVGSRGISSIVEVTAATVEWLQSIGTRPFVVPAMGSHGGATPEGQTQVLASLGVTPETVGCEIRATMETVCIGESQTGIAIHSDKIASQADHVILINRIKPHTRLVGDIQSGLCKMLMIGLGNHHGASRFHQAFKQFDYRLDHVAPDFVSKLIASLPITLGVAIVEDAFDQPGRIEVLPSEEFLTREPKILEVAQQWMPGLPFRQAEFLIVDEMGKEISGTGIDTNVVGRKACDRQAQEEEWPKIDEIYVRSLTDKTAGNASGIGVTEYTHQRVVNAIDFAKTRINSVTAGHVSGAAVPASFESDLAVFQAVRSQSATPADEVRWMRIRNTLDLAEIGCSEGYWEEAQRREDLECLNEPVPMQFTATGDLAT
ncbi:MAG: lactate racemase domain-containing protein, partial [Planctomycetota bacterium]